jgi:hypothetical protein
MGIATRNPCLLTAIHWAIEVNDLVTSMHSCIGTTGTLYTNTGISNLAKRELKIFLNRGNLRLTLTLPAMVSTAIITDSEGNAIALLDCGWEKFGRHK